MTSRTTARSPWAAMRDESLTANERHRPNAKVHIGTDSGQAACGSFFLDETLVFDPAEVGAWSRCRRSGCRKRYLAADAASAGQSDGGDR